MASTKAHRQTRRFTDYVHDCWKKRGPTVPEPVEGTAGGFDRLSHRRTKSARNGPFLNVFLSSASDFALEVVAKRALQKLSDQLDRASISAVLNFAEGAGR